MSCSRSATPSAKVRAYSFCHRKGGWSTTVGAPTSCASSIDASTLPQGSALMTRWVSSSVGAWIETMSTPWCSASASRAPAFCETGSDQTMTSTPS